MSCVGPCVCYASHAGLTIAILSGLDVDKLTGNRDATGATIALFVLHGTAAAGFTYCLTYLFKVPASAQNVMIFINESERTVEHTGVGPVSGSVCHCVSRLLCCCESRVRRQLSSTQST